MKRKHKEPPADEADVPVVSQPLPGSEAEDGGDSHSNGAEAAALKDRAPSGQLRSSRRRVREGAPPSAVDEVAAADAGVGGARKRRNTRRTENGTAHEADAAEGPASPPRWMQADAAEPDIGSERDITRLGESVVKVFCVHSEPNYSLPWQRKRQFSSTGSGFLLPDRRILTNAHCVDHHSQVKVRRRGSDTKFIATVLAIGTECDIAMLTVKDDTFWQGVEPVRFGTLPHLQDSILVIGYPIGGDSQSVTSGVVSRIEVTAYVHGSTELLGMQIDAAINSGNSGGPAFNHKGECVGIAFQSLKEDAENIGYVIPPPVIRHFIDDFARNGRYTGFPALGIEWQKLESPALQKALGMRPGSQKGVLVRRVEPTCPTSKVLRKGDILLQFDGTEIGYDGTVAFRSGERINFSYLISEKQNNDTAQLKILRDGKVSTTSLQLKGPHRLIPSHLKGAAPSYYIFSGFVFTAVTVPYLKSEYGKEFEFDSPVKILDKLLHAMADSASEQVVVVGQVLASDINIGFEDIVNTQVLRINDKPVSNLREVVAAIDGAKPPYIRLDLDYDQVVILETEAGRKATPDILAAHGIPFDRSIDLRTGEQQQPVAAA